MAERTAAPPVEWGAPAAAGRAWVVDRRWIGRLAAAWLVAVVAVLPAHGTMPARVRMLTESVVYLLWFAALLSFVPVRAWVRALPSPHRLVLAGFFFAVTVGQLALANRRTFPFPGWTMYGRPESPPTLQYYRYHGVDAHGRAVALDPGELFTFVNAAEFASRVKAIGRAATAPNETPRKAAARAQVRDLLHTLGTAYNRKHPDAPLRSLAFLRYDWDYRGGPAADVRPDTVLRVALPAGVDR